MELNKKIKTLRENAKLTQKQLAALLHISSQSVSKWENGLTMPDITLLPSLAEVFGISLDELFDLTVSQKLNRIENRLDIEYELPQDVFSEYEEFLKSNINNDDYKEKCMEIFVYLYWHKMDFYSKKVSKYARESISLNPNVKNTQWMLGDAERHAVWDWNASHHNRAIEFYRALTDENPDAKLPLLYLIDNLIADHRTDEAEFYLNKLSKIKDSNPIMNKIYLAHIELARFNEAKAEKIIKDLITEHPADSVCLFEVAQYYAKKCNYEKAIDCYEKSFDCDTEKPRYYDALQAVADIRQITGDYKKAAETYDRIINLLKTEWNFTEETVLKDAIKEKERLLKIANKQNTCF